MAVLLALGGLCVLFPSTLILTAAIFLLLGLISATHDVALDGYYLLALDARAQAFFSGVRSTAYRLAMLSGSGLLVWLAGWLIQENWDSGRAWGAVYLGAAAVLGLLTIYHLRFLPRPEADRNASERGASTCGPRPTFLEVWRTYFAEPGVGALIAFILLYRLGEALLSRMLGPFLRDPVNAGGLGLSTEAVGLAYGTCGVLGLVVGGLLGGALISRVGLRRCLWPLVLCINLPNLLYVHLAAIQSQPWLAEPGGWDRPWAFWVATAYVTFEQFGYGLGFALFLVILMRSVGPRYPTAHYALSTGFMALGMMVPGSLSGELQAWLGYHHFFLLACVLTIPGMLVIPRLRLLSANA